MSRELRSDVVIIGAGISGLASAHFLKKSGLGVLILEKESRAGGSIETENRDGFLIEYGPNSTLDTSPILHELFEDTGTAQQMEYANDKSKNRYIMRDGRLNALPTNPIAFLKTPHFSLSAKMRLLKEPFISSSEPEIEETLAEFVVRRLGREFLDYAIDPFVAGVYAGLPEELSVKSAFPKLYALEQKYGSLIKGAIMGARERKKRAEVSKQSARLFSFQNGMQDMVRALESQFSGELFLNAGLEKIEKTNGAFSIAFIQSGEIFQIETRNILLTIPAYAYSDLPGSMFQPAQTILNQIYHPPVTMVYFGYRQNVASRPLDGFGFLIPRKENRQILGTIWSSTIFRNRAPSGGIALTTFVGGGRQPENALLPENRLVQLVYDNLKDILGLHTFPEEVAVRLWPKAIPQYQVGHQKLIDRIESFENQHPGIYISGNFRGGISVGDCIKQSKEIAGRMKADSLTEKKTAVKIPEE